MDDDDGEEVASGVHRYDPVSNSWTTAAPMTRSRAFFGLFVLRGCMHAADHAETEMYDPSSDSWSAVSSMKYHYQAACAVTFEVDAFDTMIANAVRAEEERGK